mgnify:FL=1
MADGKTKKYGPPPNPVYFFNLIKLNNPKKMKQFAVILLLTLGFSINIEAQSFLNDLRKEKPGQGTVTVSQSKDIDELVNNAKLVKSAPATANNDNAGHNNGTTEQRQPQNQGQERKDTAEEPLREQHYTPGSTGSSTDSPAISTTKKVMRNSRRITGYRVQAYAGGNSRVDRQKAENIGSAIKMRFPDLPVYVHFYSPRWICRVGNFRTYQEASNVLKEIKSMGYKQACIVKGKITVGY